MDFALALFHIASAELPQHIVYIYIYPHTHTQTNKQTNTRTETHILARHTSKLWKNSERHRILAAEFAEGHGMGPFLMSCLAIKEKETPSKHH